jgi:hypothetical protein
MIQSPLLPHYTKPSKGEKREEEEGRGKREEGRGKRVHLT